MASEDGYGWEKLFSERMSATSAKTSTSRLALHAFTMCTDLLALLLVGLVHNGVHREFYYHSLYSHDGSFGGEYKLIGSHPSNNFTSAFLYLGGDLTEDISDEITFHMDERIDGAIEKFSYHGPKKSLAMSIAIRAGESSFQVTFKKVCLEGIGDLSVNYVAAEESP